MKVVISSSGGFTLSRKAYKHMGIKCTRLPGGGFFSYEVSDFDKEFRSSEKLIKAIEELGKNANGEGSELKIVEIPDGIDFEITEYHGSELIEEVHRIWS